MPSLVVALRWAGSPPRDAASTSRIALDVRAAIERASVGGGRLVGVVADGASFGFDEDTLEEAIELAIAYVHDRPDGVVRWKVGVGYGELVAVRAEEAFERLSIGPGAMRASSLARIAQVGEVLVDAAIPEASVGALLSIGRRVATDGAGGRFRGLVLDDAEPWRKGGGESVEKVRTPTVIGRESAFAAVGAVMPGGLGVVRAALGMGGTRFFEELASRTARALVITPAGCSVEPLGALRVGFQRALERAALRLSPSGRDAPTLTPRADASLRRLVEGQGIDVDTASEIIGEWLRSDTPDETPLVLVDDAMSVDRASLEAIGLAASAAGATFTVLARLDSGDVVPAALSGLVVEADVTIKQLQPHEASAMLEDACGGPGALTAEVKKRWSRRGGAIPLAIMESLRHGLMVGELALRNGLVTPRSKTAGRGRTLSSHAWVTRRFAALALDRPVEATIASVVAIAGAQLPRRRLGEVANDLGLPTGSAMDEVVARLCREGVLVSDGDRLSTSSRTLHDAALERTDEATRRRLHGALAAAFAQTARGLDLAEGAHHAALAGDHLGAASLATRAAERAKQCGLDEWAEALSNFARAEGHPGPMATTPSPPPGAASRAPRMPAVPSIAPVDLEPFESPESDVHHPKTTRTPAPAIAAAKPRPQPQPAAIVDSPLNTGQIAALPSPSFAKMLVAKEAAKEAVKDLAKVGPAKAPPAPRPITAREAPAPAPAPVAVPVPVPAPVPAPAPAPVPAPAPAPAPIVVPAPRAAPPRPSPPRPAPPRRSDEATKTLENSPLLKPPSIAGPPPDVSDSGVPDSGVPDLGMSDSGLSDFGISDFEMSKPERSKPEVSDADATTEFVGRIPLLEDEAPPLAPDELAGLDGLDGLEGIAGLEGLDGPPGSSDDELIVVSSLPSVPGFGSAPEPSLGSLAEDARRALADRNLAALDACLVQLETAGGSPCAIARLRGLSAVARGDLGGGFRLLRRARADAKSEREIARASLAYAIALGAVGRLDDALLEALSALARERKLQPRPSAKGNGSAGDLACRRLIARLLEASPSEAPAPS